MSEWASKSSAVGAMSVADHALGGSPLAEVKPGPRGNVAAAILSARGRLPADWFAIGLAAAFSLHLAFVGIGYAKEYLHDLRVLCEATRAKLHDYFWALYDVDLAPKPKAPPKAEEPPPPPPEEPPPPAPAPKMAPKLKDDPYDKPPPTPAEASKIVTAKDDDDKPEDLTGFKIVSGDGTALGGMQSGAGKGDQITHSAAAQHGGTPGGTGTAVKPPPGPDLSRGASLLGGSQWNCAFPPEADSDQVDSAVVSIAVTVRSDGTPASVSVLADPGHGFGRAARQCAMGRRYNPAFDRAGNAITASGPPISVRFTR